MFDLVLKNLTVVRPSRDTVDTLDIGINNGKFASIEQDINADSAREIRDCTGLTAFPGLVDSHMHVGIYSPLEKDAVTESKAAAMGGVTTAVTYFRTGQYYLNEGGSYHDFYPKVLDISAVSYTHLRAHETAYTIS